MKRLDCSFLFGLLVVVFAWLSPSNHWTRIGLLIVGLLIILHAFSPCFCKTCAVPVSKKPAMKSSRKKATKRRKK